MIFNEHSKLAGQHAFLSASGYHWLNYSPEKLREVYYNQLAKQRGTILHAFAAQCITLNQRLPKSPKTLNLYVNDAIGYRMTPEQVLYYSDNCFGTADTISFRNNFLRIHDLKTGETPAHMEQLRIYAALFCLEYNVNPIDISIELRLYQSDEIIVENPIPEDIQLIMNKIVEDDKIIEEIKRKE